MANTRPTDEQKGVPVNQEVQTLVNLLMQELRKFKVHVSLQDRIRASGHELTHAGICAGVSGMSMQNWLLSRTEGIKTFKRRIDLILEMKEEEFKTLDPGVQTTRDISALFDGIHAYQENELLNQSIDTKGIQSPLEASPIVISKELQEKGNLVLANSFIDVYDQNDLVDYLEKLKETQEKYPGQTLGFQLTNSMHRIFVGYDMTNNSWTLIDIDDFQEIFFESSDAVARQIISGLSPNKASDFSDLRLLQQKLQTDLSDLREKLKSCSAHFSIKRGDYIIRYDANTAQFTVQNPKPGPCPAIFTTDIYTISSIQKKLETYLEKLVCVPEIKSSEDTILNIELQHLTHKIKIQYNRATKTWLLFSNEDVSTSCGNTKDTRQITQWVMSEFLTSNNLSILQIEVRIGKQSDIIRDPDIDILKSELDRNHGISTLAINKEKALACDANGATCLFYAAMKGCSDLVLRLVEAGADVNKATHNGLTPLAVASQAGWDEVVSILLNNQATHDPAALKHAALYGHIKVVEAFIRHGANLNEQGTAATSPLVAAALHGHLEIVKLLFAHGALNIADKENFTPLVAAALRGHLEIVKFLLMRDDTDVNNTQGKALSTTPLVGAAQNGHLQIMMMLFAHGAINTADSRNVTPIAAAALQGQIEVVRFLLSRQDTDINKADNLGRSPLFVAAMYGHVHIVRLLLENKAYINQASNENETPLAVARAQGRSDVVQFLLENDASDKVSFSNGIDNILKTVPDALRNSYFPCMATLLQPKNWGFHFSADTGTNALQKQDGYLNQKILCDEQAGVAYLLKAQGKIPDNRFLDVYKLKVDGLRRYNLI